jgi:transcriptional regulator with XRE-family HTH domain
VRYKNNSVYDPEAAVERLREFLRLNYLTGNQVARRIGVRDTTIYSWLQGKSTPRSATAARINAFLRSLPAERAGIMPAGYEYREYKNWRGIPKPRRRPFCKQAKGEVRKVKLLYQRVCPNCGATGPKRGSYDGALMAWNEKDSR